MTPEQAVALAQSLGFNTVSIVLAAGLVWLATRYKKVEDDLSNCYESLGKTLEGMPAHIVEVLRASGTVTNTHTTTISDSERTTVTTR